jgi:hypothetical protein
LCSIFLPLYRLMQAPCSFKSAISWVQLKTNYMFLINNPGITCVTCCHLFLNFCCPLPYIHILTCLG